MEIPALVYEANVPSPSPKMTTPIATRDDPSAPYADSPGGLTQKNMESSTPIPEVVFCGRDKDSGSEPRGSEGANNRTCDSDFRGGCGPYS